jgi:hypothetical protein
MVMEALAWRELHAVEQRRGQRERALRLPLRLALRLHVIQHEAELRIVKLRVRLLLVHEAMDSLGRRGVSRVVDGRRTDQGDLHLAPSRVRECQAHLRPTPPRDEVGDGVEREPPHVAPATQRPARSVSSRPGHQSSLSESIVERFS